MDSEARVAIECLIPGINLKSAVEEGDDKYPLLFQNQSSQEISFVLLILLKSFWDIVTIHSWKNWICTIPPRVEVKASCTYTRESVHLGSLGNEFCLIQPTYLLLCVLI